MPVSIHFYRVLILLAITFTAVSCRTVPLHDGGYHSGSGPDHSSLYRYYYYPNAEVYFDIQRNLYFHLSEGIWNATVSLPHALRIQLTDHVSLELDTLKPYQYHYKTRQHYPPGQLKKQRHDYGKHRGEEYSNGRGYSNHEHDDYKQKKYNKEKGYGSENYKNKYYKRKGKWKDRYDDRDDDRYED